MKWIKIDNGPFNDDTRIIEIFCLWPRSIVNGDKTEYRWLETVKIRQRYSANGYTPSEWRDIEFLN
jgi:hypothetical protein